MSDISLEELEIMNRMVYMGAYIDYLLFRPELRIVIHNSTLRK